MTARLGGVFACFDHVLGDLAAQGDGVCRIVLGEAAEDGELGAEVVAFGNGGDDLFRRALDDVEGMGGVDLCHGDRDSASLPCEPDLLGAEEGGFHGEDFGDHVGECGHDLLLVGDLVHVLLRGGTGGEERELLGLREEVEFFGER